MASGDSEWESNKIVSYLLLVIRHGAPFTIKPTIVLCYKLFYWHTDLMRQM
jgi:hypothetical protein